MLFRRTFFSIRCRILNVQHEKKTRKKMSKRNLRKRKTRKRKMRKKNVRKGKMRERENSRKGNRYDGKHSYQEEKSVRSVCYAPR